LVDQHERGLRDYSAPIWSLLMFDSFLRSVLQVPSVAPIRASA
jgi:asparagine synthase (glutamine-hydrolysing)